jgi:hypothetical protein
VGPNVGYRFVKNKTPPPPPPPFLEWPLLRGKKWLKSLHVFHLFFSSYFTILQVIQLHYTEMPLGIVMGSWKHGAIFNEYLPYEQNDEFILVLRRIF